MASEISDRFVILVVVLSAVLVLYFFGLAVFLENHLWLVSIVAIYVFFFLMRDSVYKKKSLDELVKTKSREDVRIDFWRGLFF